MHLLFQGSHAKCMKNSFVRRIFSFEIINNRKDSLSHLRFQNVLQYITLQRNFIRPFQTDNSRTAVEHLILMYVNNKRQDLLAEHYLDIIYLSPFLYCYTPCFSLLYSLPINTVTVCGKTFLLLSRNKRQLVSIVIELTGSKLRNKILPFPLSYIKYIFSILRVRVRGRMWM